MLYRGFTQPGYDASSSLPIYPSPSTGSSTTAPASTPTSSGGGYIVPATSSESSGGYASLLSQLAAGSGSSSAGSGSTSSSIFSGINWTLIIILIAAVLIVKYLFGGK